MSRLQLDALFHRIALEVSGRVEHIRFPVVGLPKAIFIDPMRIEFGAGSKKHVLSSRRLFRRSGWLSERKPMTGYLEEGFRYATCGQLLFNGAAIEETEEYANLVARLERDGVTRDGMSSVDEVKQYMERIRRMYLDVQATGRLRTQEELGLRPYGNEINFLLDRDLTLLKTTDGTHRFAVARLLRLRSIPIQISVIHADLIPHIMRFAPGHPMKALRAFLRSVEEQYGPTPAGSA